MIQVWIFFSVRKNTETSGEKEEPKPLQLTAEEFGGVLLPQGNHRCGSTFLAMKDSLILFFFLFICLIAGWLWFGLVVFSLFAMLFCLVACLFVCLFVCSKLALLFTIEGFFFVAIFKKNILDSRL